jgi:hypothetical protein
MNFPELKSAMQRAWHSAPQRTRAGLALLAYLLVVGVMGTAAALISSEMPFSEPIPSFK